MKTQTLTCNVVMLPTKWNNILLDLRTGKLQNYNGDYQGESKPQHLYFVSDREIKEGDHILHCSNAIGKILEVKELTYKVQFPNEIVDCQNYNCKKVEATTDPSLNHKSPKEEEYFKTNSAKDYFNQLVIPSIPQSFIEVYVKANGDIKEVNIEIKQRFTNSSNYAELQRSEFIYIIKTRPDNTVIIHPSKTYTKEEVVNLLSQYRLFGETDLPSFNKFIQENL